MRLRARRRCLQRCNRRSCRRVCRTAERHLIPRQFAWSRAAGDAATLPQMIVREDKSILYQFKPQMASAERFEKIGEGPGYIWGFGSGLSRIHGAGAS